MMMQKEKEQAKTITGTTLGRYKGRHGSEQQDPDKMSVSNMRTPTVDRP
jgi:hypothetical protein